jgi:hypothetical protein
MADEDDSGSAGAAPPRKGWGRILIWAGAITTLLGVPTAGAGFLGMFDSWWPPEVQVRLTTCEQYKIVLSTTNTGGRTATVGPPIFTVTSPRRPPNTPLRMSSYMDAVPADAGNVAPDGNALQTYDAHTRFFNEPESRGHACHIQVSVPVSEGSGALPSAGDECECVYR